MIFFCVALVRHKHCFFLVLYTHGLCLIDSTRPPPHSTPIPALQHLIHSEMFPQSPPHCCSLFSSSCCSLFSSSAQCVSSKILPSPIHTSNPLTRLTLTHHPRRRRRCQPLVERDAAAAARAPHHGQRPLPAVAAEEAVGHLCTYIMYLVGGWLVGRCPGCGYRSMYSPPIPTHPHTCVHPQRARRRRRGQESARWPRASSETFLLFVGGGWLVMSLTYMICLCK